MLNWIIINKEWIFSGIGIVILSVLFSIVKEVGSHNSKEPQNKAILKVIETLRHDAHTVEFKFINEGEISAYISKIIMHLSFDGYGPIMVLGHKRAYVYEIRVLHPNDNAISVLNKLLDKENSLSEHYGLMRDVEGKSTIVARLEGGDKHVSHLEIPVSQEVPAKGVDRIILKFESNANPPPKYKAHAQFIFNDGKSVVSDKFDVWL